MPGTFTLDLITVNQVENTTGLVSNGWTTALAAVDDYRIQGNFALAGRASNTTAFGAFAPSTGVGRGSTFTGSRSDDHVFAWTNNFVPTATDTKANGGITVWASSGDSTFALTGTTPNNSDNNSRNWNVDGRDSNQYGGFTCYVVNPFNSGSYDVGSFNRGTVGLIGVRQKTTSAVANGNLSFVFDAIRVGTGVRITSGTITNPVTLEDVFVTGSNTGSAIAAIPSGAWGIVTKRNDTYFGAARLYIGTETQTTPTQFTQRNANMVWSSFPVSQSFYQFNVTASTGFSSSLQFGDWDGTLASNGVSISAPSGSVWNLICGQQSSSIKIYDSSFTALRFGILYSGSEVRSSTFARGGTLISSGARIDNASFLSNIVGYGSASLQVNNTSSLNNRVTNTAFIGNYIGIQLASAGTHSFDNLTFSNNTYDVFNSSGGHVYINATNGSNPSILKVLNSAGSTTNIINAVSLTLTDIVANSEVRIYSAGTETELAGQEDVNSGTFVYAYSYVPVTLIDIVVHNIDYVYYRVNNYALGAENASLPIQQVFDRNYSNP